MRLTIGFFVLLILRDESVSSGSRFTTWGCKRRVEIRRVSKNSVGSPVSWPRSQQHLRGLRRCRWLGCQAGHLDRRHPDGPAGRRLQAVRSCIDGITCSASSPKPNMVRILER
jgi:hypothetical protein